MQDKYQLFTAFFIPFSAALVLLYFFSGLFPVYQNTSGVSFGLYDYRYLSFPVSAEKLYILGIFSLLVLSFGLPVFMYSRAKPTKKAGLNLTQGQK